MTEITKEAIEAAKAAYWHEAHNGGGYSDKCYEAALTAALPFLSPIAGKPDMLRLAVAAVLEADKEFRANMPPEWEGDPLSDEIDGLRCVYSALSTLPIAGEAPEGWQWVPVEPTVAMRMPWKTMRGYDWYDKYKAMLAAAPQPNPSTLDADRPTSEGE